MQIEQVKRLLQESDYDFLRNNPHLGKNIQLIGLGGSHAYGLNTESSDLDIRGIATNTAADILSDNKFEQIVDEATDTTIYSLDKIVKLLSNCNPNTIELLGLKPEHYIYLNEIGAELVKNADMFLSKLAIHSFGGYANSQLRRLENKAVRDMDQSRHEQHILNSIENASSHFTDRYHTFGDGGVRLFVDDAVNDGYDKEIFIDATMKHYPLRDYLGMWAEMKDIVRSYDRIGSRNSKAIEHSKLAKHMCHLVRLYLMCFDILSDGKIVTYREKDHDFLMDIRNGKYLDAEEKPTKEFYDIVDDLDQKLAYWKTHTHLPDKPDYKRINQFLIDTNLSVVLSGDTWIMKY